MSIIPLAVYLLMTDVSQKYMNKENIASVNTAKANGMKFVKEYFDGEENLCVYAITRKEWENDII